MLGPTLAPTLAKIVAFGLFLALGFAAIPLMLRVFLWGQRRIGNEAVPMVRFLAEHQTGVVVAVWIVFALGLAVALPAMLADEFFGRPAKLWFEARLRGANRGVLTANVGMTLEDIRRRSTLPISEPRGESLTGSSRLAADVVFDLDIADTGTRFPECRYYFLVTRSHGDPHVESMNVGVSPHAMTRPEHDDERRRVQERLQADGWKPGRFVYRTPEQQALHGGKTSEGDRTYWLKGEALLHLEPKRVDEAQRGEDEATAGRFMLAVSIFERTASSTYPRLDFTAP
jgi:hypothetical protein